jgi:hemerythrin-like metal-binding protein
MNFKEWEWPGNIITGNDALDFRHQSLINIVNDIIGSYNSSDGNPSPLLIEVPLDELFKFAAHHFADEELVMKNFKYDNLVKHHESHVSFVVTLINLKIRFDKDENIATELLDFLLRWRKQHIEIKDKEAMKVCRRN